MVLSASNWNKLEKKTMMKMADIAEKEIDHVLEEATKTITRSIFVNLSFCLDSYVMNELERRYKKEGWRIEFDDRDASILILFPPSFPGEA